MQEERFTVRYVTVNTCFAYLPEQWLRRLASRPNVVKVLHNDVNYYLSWCTRPSPDNTGALCLSATFARTLNIKEGDEVFVSCAEEAPPLTSLIVAPKSSHDREILELQSENVQSNLLDQISVVAKNQSIVAWVSKFLSVTLIVKSLNPHFRYGRLEQNTEIHVGEADSVVAAQANPSPKVVLSIMEKLRCSQDLAIPGVYRVHPLPRVDPTIFIPKCKEEEALRSPFCVFMSKPTATLARVRKVREGPQHVKSTGPKFSGRGDDFREYVVSICSLEELLRKSQDVVDASYFTIFALHPCLYMTKGLMENLRIKVGGKVTMELIKEPSENIVSCTAIDIFPHESFISEEIFRNYVSRNSMYDRLLLNSHGTVIFEDETRCLVKLLPENCTHDFFNDASIRKIEVNITDAVNIKDSRSVDKEVEVIEIPIKNVALDVLQPIIAECKVVLNLNLGLHNISNFDCQRKNILISGSTGAGKSTVCKLLQEILSEPPYFVHMRYIDCRSMKGKKADVIQKLLATEISHAVYYQPSILFFDDIESITSAGSNTEENTPDSMNAARITDAIFNTVTEYQDTNYISILATCTDMSKVGKKLREPRGVHFFGTILTIPNLEREERIKILRSSLEDKLYLAKEIDWEHYGNKTEGWVAQDLVVLADKAVFTAWKRHVSEKLRCSLILQDEDLALTLSRCSPISLQGVSLYKGAGHSWSDIGGLNSVKLVLVEILHWPLKYPDVFKNAPVKLQSGILLYGMPGTGKTMLAGAVVRECGLNLISVKGPELLSKYIGASEEAVRNLFEKAKRAKPCVLFFDEFDSLAPRRGHDSTGVTDRVVNQLLTHLDGIEGREGVAVVAASSRPDLLDPALLRPGRLDKSLLCPLPDENDREDILEALCRTHEVDTQDLDLRALAKLTAGFTGADLNAILIQARLNAIETTNSSAEEENRDFISKKLTQKGLLDSVNATKPSLLASEKEKYNRIYSKFAKRESYPIEDLKHQKATLA